MKGNRCRIAAAALSMVVCGALGARAHEPPPEARRSLRVSGVGEVRVAADLALLAFGVQTTGKIAAAAAGENAGRTAAVVEALRRALPAAARVETLRYSLEPQYETAARGEARPGPPRIRGYRATNEVEVRTDDLATVGKLIDVAIGAGANRVASLRFTLRDEAPPRQEAIRTAGHSAREMAEALADSLGVTLGSLQSASVAPERIYTPQALRMGGMMAAEAAATPVEPGEVTVRATVEATYEIR